MDDTIVRTGAPTSESDRRARSTVRGSARAPRPYFRRARGTKSRSALTRTVEVSTIFIRRGWARSGHDYFHVTALIGRWRAATATLTWVNCDHPPAYLVNTDGELNELEGTPHPALGTGPPDPSYHPSERQLHPGERLILLTDGITKRRMQNGETFGVDGLRHALQRAENPTAASTAMAIQQAVTDCWREPLQDDATVVVMAIE